jgi:beta-phosphoglucomutase
MRDDHSSMRADANHIPRAVLWDLDGTLLDSREHHWLAWRETMAAEGRELSEADFSATFGQRNERVLRQWFGPDLPASEIRRISDAKEVRYRELLRSGGACLLPGVERWLERLHADGWQQALATSAPPENVEAALDALHVSPYFGAVVHSDDVSRSKPDPQVFLVAAERLHVPPARCIVVEDAPAGIEAARRARMRCIGVGPLHGILPADLTAPTLDHILGNPFEMLLDG